MNYTYEQGEKSQVKLTVTLDKTDWEKAIHDAYLKNKGKYNIQGFRKGHVPFNVIANTYGVEVFYEDAINVAIQEYYPEILKNEAEKINPVGDPEFGLESVNADGVVFTALIPVMPEVKIASYKGIKVEKVEYNVTDEDIDKDIERLRDRNSREVSVTDRPCEMGDKVVIDFSGSVDGVKFEGGTAEKYQLVLGSGSFIPGFEAQVCGMTIGEDRDINVTFPEDYAENLKGKDAVFSIHLHEILFKELPELTDDFIKDATGEESLEAYKDKTRNHLQTENDQRAKNENEDKLLNAIAENTEVVIPDCMIEDEVNTMVQQLQYRLMYQGLKFEDYLSVTGQTEEVIRDSYKQVAGERVKKQLIVSKIIELEGIVATEDEVNVKVEEQAKSVGKEVEEYRANMDPRQFDYIRNSIIVDKLFDFLMANNEVA